MTLVITSSGARYQIDEEARILTRLSEKPVLDMETWAPAPPEKLASCKYREIHTMRVGEPLIVLMDPGLLRSTRVVEIIKEG